MHCFLFMLLPNLAKSCVPTPTPTTTSTSNKCPSCPDFLVSVSAPAKDVLIATANACDVRMLTCPAPRLKWNEGVITPVAGVSTLLATCDEDGSAWIFEGKTVTSVECIQGRPPCQTSCAHNLIAVTANGVSSHPMDSDVIDRTPGNCATRTFTCFGNMAAIEFNNAGTIGDGDDGAVDGVATFTVTCNAAGTAWVNTGVEITQVECSTV